MTPTIIGLDIGTTSIKATAFDVHGRALASAGVPTPTHHPRADWAFFEPDELWRGTCIVLRKTVAALPAEYAPASVAVASVGESGVPLDVHGEPTHNIIAWFDRRTIAQAEWWHAHVGWDRTLRTTGLSPRVIYGANKMLWLRDNEPDAWRRTARWLNVADWIAFKLCGEQAADYSLASRTLLFNLARREWSADLLTRANLPASLLPTAVPSGTHVGDVHAAAAQATGLGAGMPVAAGGQDHVCGAFALGITEHGEMVDSMGTAESLFVALAQPVLDSERAVGFPQGAHVVPERAYAMGGMYLSGGAVDWGRRLLGEPEVGYAEFVALATNAPPGSGGVFFLPHLRMANPPQDDPLARGAFLGLSTDIERRHLARAVLEGLAHEAYASLVTMSERFDLAPQHILAIGGGARNELWIKIKAAVSGLPFHVAQTEEAVCLGAAMLGGIGAGVYDSFAQALQQVRIATKTIEPDARLHAFYAARHEQVYVKLYETLKPLNHTISKNFVEQSEWEPQMDADKRG